MEPVLTKRIAILVARNNFVYRGVGAYVKSIIDWAVTEKYCVDIISDDEPRDNGMFDAYRNDVNWIAPKVTIKDAVYKDLSVFSKPFDTVLSLNFRNALVEAVKQHTYDLIITNVGEALHAVTSIGAHKYCTVLHPTHHESEAGVKVRHDIFSPGVCEQYQALCNLPDVALACQSAWVKASADVIYSKKTNEIFVVPPLVPEPALLNFNAHIGEKWGVGFIGPWEPRKNPEAYVQALKKTNLPAVVLVPSEASAKKFKAKLTEANIQHKIYVGVTGAEKTRIIQSMAAAYHPAVSETFGLGALETAHACPTVLLKKNEWSQAHENYCVIVDEQYVADTLLKVYGEPVADEVQNFLVNREKFARQQLRDLVCRETTTQVPNNNFYKKLEQDGLVKHSDFTSGLASMCTDEIYKMLKIPSVSSVEILHTRDATYYRNKGSGLLPTTAVAAESLFEFS